MVFSYPSVRATNHPIYSNIILSITKFVKSCQYIPFVLSKNSCKDPGFLANCSYSWAWKIISNLSKSFTNSASSDVWCSYSYEKYINILYMEICTEQCFSVSRHYKSSLTLLLREEEERRYCRHPMVRFKVLHNKALSCLRFPDVIFSCRVWIIFWLLKLIMW